MKNLTKLDGAALVIWLLPGIYLAAVYPNLPASVPLHYGPGGVVDRYGSPKEFLTANLLMIGISLLSYLFLRVLKFVDPKKKIQYSEDVVKKIGFGVLVFIALLNCVIIYVTVHRGIRVDAVILPLASLLLAFMGNFMNNLKPNYFVGIRTPWTLESEATWRATHRLAAKIWFIGGLLLAVITPVLPAALTITVFLPCVLLMAFVPMVYSFFHFKKNQQQHLPE